MTYTDGVASSLPLLLLDLQLFLLPPSPRILSCALCPYCTALFRISCNMTDAHDQDREPPLAREDVEDPQPSSDETSQHSQEKAEAKEQTPVEKVESKHSVNNVASIPNGGLKAWLQVLGAFFLFFNTWYENNTHALDKCTC